MPDTFECPNCGETEYSVLGAYAVYGPYSEDMPALCWHCEYVGDVGEAPDFEENPDQLPF